MSPIKGTQRGGTESDETLDPLNPPEAVVPNAVGGVQSKDSGFESIEMVVLQGEEVSPEPMNNSGDDTIPKEVEKSLAETGDSQTCVKQPVDTQLSDPKVPYSHHSNNTMNIKRSITENPSMEKKTQEQEHNPRSPIQHPVESFQNGASERDCKCPECSDQWNTAQDITTPKSTDFPQEHSGKTYCHSSRRLGSINRQSL